ncbi:MULTISPECIES: hypothetical protein [unclassified Mesorhizobium]|uniref:hypothetical protein n=1 Tax=unclassified Mesorhizobium TaxID=325217 RepID=UPI000FCA25B7|nr:MULTISPECIES: hypothetical protein [unclassified Mesorhizobium]RUX90258.1 hypothetical protein EN993_31310 [Mesorhizobium sp. M7D.F.Ca.US.004.01.2.1]RVA22144.1 hypothetical protein EN935_30455 [Mesorhizobium sp. M7D.F.Ca.US.004.03.1.1]
MHVVTLLKANMFDVEIDGKPASIAEALPDWNPHDRFGLVIDDALGGIGATHLLQIAITSFYDVKPSRRTELTVYPEIYAFHIGKGYGAHAPYDFWPARREVITSRDHREVLDAINDRGITRLAVPDRQPQEVVHRPKEVDAALDRIVSAFVYSPSGRVSDPDLVISGNDRRTEYNPNSALRPRYYRQPAGFGFDGSQAGQEVDPSYQEWLRKREHDLTSEERAFVERRREALRQDGLVTETYRRAGVREALMRLASAGLD